MKVPGKGGTPSLIIFQKFTAHGHVPGDHVSRDERARFLGTGRPINQTLSETGSSK